MCDLSVIFVLQLSYLSSLDRAVSAGRLTVTEKDALFTSAVEKTDITNSNVRLYVTNTWFGCCLAIHNYKLFL